MSSGSPCPRRLPAADLGGSQGTSWPPPPHDPRDRELIARVAGWEIRLPRGRLSQSLVSNGFWHVQLWNPLASVSVLTPSRLTDDRYEAFLSAGSRLRAQKYGELERAIAEQHSVPLLPESALLELERACAERVKTRARRMS